MKFQAFESGGLAILNMNSIEESFGRFLEYFDVLFIYCYVSVMFFNLYQSYSISSNCYLCPTFFKASGVYFQRPKQPKTGLK